MPKKPFTIPVHISAIDKSFNIQGPDIRLSVDYDDVDHKEVLRLAKRIVATLNEHWDSFIPVKHWNR